MSLRRARGRSPERGEAEALLRGLDGVESFGAMGPHGRPILLRVPLSEIARLFGR